MVLHEGIFRVVRRAHKNFFQIYRPINDSRQAISSDQGDIQGRISKNQFWDIIFTGVTYGPSYLFAATLRKVTALVSCLTNPNYEQACLMFYQKPRQRGPIGVDTYCGFPSNVYNSSRFDRRFEIEVLKMEKLICSGRRG